MTLPHGGSNVCLFTEDDAGNAEEKSGHVQEVPRSAGHH